MLASVGGHFFRTEGVIGSTWQCLSFNWQTSLFAMTYYCYRDFYQLLFSTCCWFGYRLNFCIPDRLSCCFQSLARVSIGYTGCKLNACYWISGSLWFAGVDSRNLIYCVTARFEIRGCLSCRFVTHQNAHWRRIYPIGCVDFMLGTWKIFPKNSSLFDFESKQVSDIG